MSGDPAADEHLERKSRVKAQAQLASDRKTSRHSPRSVYRVFATTKGLYVCISVYVCTCVCACEIRRVWKHAALYRARANAIVRPRRHYFGHENVISEGENNRDESRDKSRHRQKSARHWDAAKANRATIPVLGMVVPGLINQNALEFNASRGLNLHIFGVSVDISIRDGDGIDTRRGTQRTRDWNPLKLRAWRTQLSLREKELASDVRKNIGIKWRKSQSLHWPEPANNSSAGISHEMIDA